jgi:phosphopantetheine adenylyltransferase
MLISSRVKIYLRFLINLIGIDIHKKNSIKNLIKRLEDKKDFDFEFKREKIRNLMLINGSTAD